jgi:hypothetical protein
VAAAVVDVGAGETRAGPETDPGRPAEAASRARLVGALVGILVFFVFVVSPVHTITDSVWTIHTARSLVTEGNADLDEFPSALEDPDGFQLDEIDGRQYYAVPLGTSLSAIPVVLLGSIIDDAGMADGLEHNDVQPYDALAAALLVAVTALVVYGIALRTTRRVGIAVLAALIFAFATQAWSTASRTLWMHTPSMLCLALALYCALRIRDGRRWAALLGADLALAFFVRPTNAVAVACFGVWLCTLGWTYARRAILGGSAIVGVFVVANVALYGQPLQPYFVGDRLEVSTTSLEALAGNLVSPARGLFLFVPIAALSFYGFFVKRKLGQLTTLDIAVAATIIGYWVVVSCLPHWWGGWSYGPRFLTDVAPFIIWFLLPVLSAVAPGRATGSRRAVSPRPILAVLLVALTTWSVLVQARGATAESTAEWNDLPQDIDDSPGRLWDWSDPPFLR